MTFERVLHLAPGHAEATFNLAALYVARKDYVRAIPLLERAAGVSRESTQPNDIALMLALANAYARANRGKDAAKLFDQIERNAGDDPRILFTLGLNVADAGDYERAAKLFGRTNSLRPDTYEVLYNLGIAFYNLDRLDEARGVLQQAATLKPEQAEVFYRLGLIASAKSESENAIGLMQRALKLRQVYPEAQFMIAEELLKNGRVDRAIPFTEQAATEAPGEPIYQIRLGVAHFRGRAYAKADATFRAALAHFLIVR